MLQRFFHFTLTCDAKRQIPKMILERLVDEYVWQEKQYINGTQSTKGRAKRVRELVENEVVRRNAQKEFNRLLATKKYSDGE